MRLPTGDLANQPPPPFVMDWSQEAEGVRPYTVADILDLPPVEFVMDELIEEHSLFALYGPPGSMKTFLMLDVALCVSAGLGWHDKASRQRPVWYVMTEGVQSARTRLKAWMTWRNIMASQLRDFRIWPREVDLSSQDDLGAFVELVMEVDRRPPLLVFDTLANCMTGDENSKEDMGLVTNNARAVIRQTGAAIGLVHHGSKASNGKVERGSSALRGAVDQMYSFRGNKGGNRILSTEKQRNQEEGPSLVFDVKRVGTGAVLVSSASRFDSGQEVAVLRYLSSVSSDGPVSVAAIIEGTDLPRSTAYHSVKTLTDKGFIAGTTVRNKAAFTITERGLSNVSRDE